MKTALKTLAAASIVLAAGFAQAQSVPVAGLDREINPSNVVGGSSYINIDQDSTTPSACLAYLSGIQIELPSGGSSNGYSYGAGAAWSKAWSTGCGLAPVQTDFFDTGFRVIYEWGSSSWHSDCDDNLGTAGTYNSVSTTDSDPNWDCAQLVVVVSDTFEPRSINLIARKKGLPLEEMVYDLYRSEE